MKRIVLQKAVISTLVITLISAGIILKTPLIPALASPEKSQPQSSQINILSSVSLSFPAGSLGSKPVQDSTYNPLPSDSIAGFLQIGDKSLNQAPPKDLACAQIWNAYPQGGYAVPDWLYTPSRPADLQTNEPYTYLAGKLLQNGLAEAPDCPFNGLLPSGFASPCGLEKARGQVQAWQNQFDQGIYDSALKNAVPARLLKNIFAQESQFWLGQSDDNQHFGIGQITEGGLDPLFLAYPEYYQLVCTDVLSAETCQAKYADLSNQNKGLIRGYFLRTVVDVSCPDCPNKFNEKKAVDTIDIFTRLVVANCQQVGRVITDITERTPGTVSTYDDLWRYTLVNYNAGSGCVSYAVETTFNAGEPLSWPNIADRVENRCSNALDYVEKVSR